MTAQFAEKMRHQGEEVAMCTNPLEDFFEWSGARPDFMFHSTALRRGYLGRWEVIDDRLYLVQLEGTLRDGTKASVASIFPDSSERVFAHWYSGTLRLPQGKLLGYVHQGYGSTFERDLFLEVERGVVQTTKVHQNGTSKSENAAEGYQIGAMTMLPLSR